MALTSKWFKIWSLVIFFRFILSWVFKATNKKWRLILEFANGQCKPSVQKQIRYTDFKLNPCTYFTHFTEIDDKTSRNLITKSNWKTLPNIKSILHSSWIKISGLQKASESKNQLPLNNKSLSFQRYARIFEKVYNLSDWMKFEKSRIC